MQHVDGAEKARALGRLVAMAKRGEFMRHGDDDAVDVAHAFGGTDEGLEIRRRHMGGHADRVDVAGGELPGEAGRRARLTDRIADDEMKARVAVEGIRHHDLLAGHRHPELRAVYSARPRIGR